MIEGLEEVTTGTISIGGGIVNDVMPAKHGVAMVFQSYALYLHMKAYDNTAFALKQARVPNAEIDARVRKAAGALHIVEFLGRRPRHLSGGQRQRVAIGRAAGCEPRILLFDEPLSDLDAALRWQTRVEIAELHARLGTAMICVTHEEVDALTLADKIVVLNGGRIEQVGTPMDPNSHTEDRFVAGFICSPQMNSFSREADIAVAVTMIGSPGTGGVNIGMRPERLTAAAPEEA